MEWKKIVGMGISFPVKTYRSYLFLLFFSVFLCVCVVVIYFFLTAWITIVKIFESV